MIKKLNPLTIYNSLDNRSTVLLTSDLKKYTFICTFSQKYLLATYLYRLLNQHFKLNLLSLGVFTFNNEDHFCEEIAEGAIEVDKWSQYLWCNQRKVNRFVKITNLFKMFLVEVYFPIFNDARKLLIPGQKDQFYLSAVPFVKANNGVEFISKSKEFLLYQPEIKQLFSMVKKQLPSVMEEFEVLHHEKLKQQLKYQISLFPEIRNVFWEEIKPCFLLDFRTKTHQKLADYLLKL